jgi:hypothetical protein
VTGLGKIVRALVGVVVLVVLVVTVNGWYSDYKRAAQSKSRASTETSSSVDSTLVVAVAGGKKVVVLVSGVVLRTTPTASGAPVRTLKKGEQLILVGTVGPWLQLRDAANGKMGYVANNAASLRVQK